MTNQQFSADNFPVSVGDKMKVPFAGHPVGTVTEIRERTAKVEWTRHGGPKSFWFPLSDVERGVRIYRGVFS